MWTDRRLVVLAGLLPTLLLLACGPGASRPALPTEATPPPVVTYQGNHLHDGKAAARLTPPLTEQWRRTLPGTLSFPLVAGGRVFVASQDPLDQVTAFDLSTGRRSWLRVLSLEGYLGLAYGSGRLFAMTGNCTVLALAPADGTTLWTRKIWSAGGDACDAPPVVRNGTVLVQQADAHHRIVALSAQTGEVRWSRSIGTAGHDPPIATDRRIFVVGLVDVLALRYDGTLVWHQRCCGFPGGGTPSLHEGRLYVRTGDGAVLDAATGEQLGVLQSDTPMAFSEDTVFRVRDANLEAVDLATGEQRWLFDPSSDITRPPLLIGEHVAVHAVDGTLSMIRATDGDVSWQTQAPPSDARGDDLCGCFIGMAATGDHLVLPAGRTLVVYG